MTITLEPWTSLAPEAKGRQLIPIPLKLLTELSCYEPEPTESGTISTWPNIITPYILTRLALWQLRHAQIQSSPSDYSWITRLIFVPYSLSSSTTQTLSNSETEGTVVGIAGFHGPPNSHGMVEVGYSVDPQFRKQGHGKAALKVMLDMARKEESLKVVRATISPENEVSKHMVVEEGFVERGEQWDEVDGREIIWELDLL